MFYLVSWRGVGDDPFNPKHLQYGFNHIREWGGKPSEDEINYALENALDSGEKHRLKTGRWCGVKSMFFTIDEQNGEIIHRFTFEEYKEPIKTTTVNKEKVIAKKYVAPYPSIQEIAAAHPGFFDSIFSAGAHSPAPTVYFDDVSTTSSPATTD